MEPLSIDNEKSAVSMDIGINVFSLEVAQVRNAKSRRMFLRRARTSVHNETAISSLRKNQILTCYTHKP